MGQRKKSEYIDSLWESGDENMLSLFFGRKLYFLRQLDIELMKLSDPHIYDEPIVHDSRRLEDLPLSEIGRIDPALERELRDGAFENPATARVATAALSAAFAIHREYISRLTTSFR